MHTTSSAAFHKKTANTNPTYSISITMTDERLKQLNGFRKKCIMKIISKATVIVNHTRLITKVA